MRETFLVQRLDPPFGGSGILTDNPFSFGGGLKNGGLSDEAMALLRPIFSFDYMGAAEFEFGAVPQALKLMASHPRAAGQLHLEEADVAKARWRKDGDLRVSTVFYLCRADQESDVAHRIRLLAKDEGSMRLKESTHLAWVLRKPEGVEFPRTRGWLELNNGFMWFIDRAMWTATASLFGVAVTEEVSRDR